MSGENSMESNGRLVTSNTFHSLNLSGSTGGEADRDLSAFWPAASAASGSKPPVVPSTASAIASFHFKPHPCRNRTSSPIILRICMASSVLTGALGTYCSFSALYVATMSGGKLTGISTSTPSFFFAVGSHCATTLCKITSG